MGERTERGSQKVDQKLALSSTAMFAAAGFLGVTLLMGVYEEEERKKGMGKQVRRAEEDVCKKI